MPRDGGGAMGVSNESVGRIAFDAYAVALNGMSAATSRPIPSWEDVGEEVRAGWQSAAEAVLRLRSHDGGSSARYRGRPQARAAQRPGMRATQRQGNGQWFEIRNAVTGGTAEVWIYDEIGYWGVTAEVFAKQVAQLDVSAITVRLNSPGGDAFDGIAIHNALRSHPAPVTVVVDALAASAASVIAMAGDTIIMNSGSQMMIHDASGLCMGNARDMEEMREVLDRMSDSLAAFYAERAGGDAASWREAMQAETWYTADEAVAAGLADQVASKQSDPAATAKFDLSVYQHADPAKRPAPYMPGHSAPETVAAAVPELVRPAARGGRPRVLPPIERPAARVAEPEQAPVFEFDPEVFKVVVENTYANAPAPPTITPDEPEEADGSPPLIFDRSAFHNAVLAAVREANK